MGIIISRLKKKKSTLEILESLEKDIKSIEEYGQTTERQHKAVVGRLLLVSVGLYVLTACLFYFFLFPASLYHQLLYVVPLLLFPLIIILLKRLVSWWYCRKLSQNQEKLSDIKKQKKELLEEVMDKETYKVAKEILEKFAPDQLRKGVAASRSGIAAAQTNSDANSKQIVLSQQNVVQGIQEMPVLARGSPGSEIRRRPIGTNALTAVERSPHRPVASVSTPLLSPTGDASSGQLTTRESTSVTSKPSVTAPVATVRCEITKASGSTNVVVVAAAAATAATSATTAPSTDLSDLNDDNNDEEEDVHGCDDDDDGVDNDKNVAGNNSSTDAEVADNGEEQEEGGPRLETTVPGPLTNLTRPILPRERSVMDRLVEYLVGDGINQRYALICYNCHSHNGMALKEEFEYLAFRCCYCLHWNPARKQRLQAPRLDALPSSGNTTTSSSAPESNTEEEDTSDGPAITAPLQETAESPSSTEAEFESMLPDCPSSTPNVDPDALSH